MQRKRTNPATAGVLALVAACLSVHPSAPAQDSTAGTTTLQVYSRLTVVDVTHIDLAQAGDQATLLGDTINAEDHAALAHTIPYEILCGIHPCG